MEVGRRWPGSRDEGTHRTAPSAARGRAGLREPSEPGHGGARRTARGGAAAGETIVTEGDEGDKPYLIAEGRAEVSVSDRAGPVPVATLGAGEVFGEIALLEPGRRRAATVAAVEPLLLLALPAEDFDRVLYAHPEARAAFSGVAEEMLVANFLKRASPFSTLDAGRLRRLAARLGRRDGSRPGAPRAGSVAVSAPGAKPYQMLRPPIDDG